MRNFIKLSLISFIFFLPPIMTGAHPNDVTDGSFGNKLQVRVHGGFHHGGIVENTDLSLIDHADPDGFTGATRPGINAGFRVAYPVNERISAETGLGIASSRHTFTYNDNNLHFFGERRINLIQLQCPLTINIILVKNLGISLNTGMLINYNYRYGLIYTDTQPDFEWRAFSAGMQIGTYIPLSFIHKKMPGIYAEFYRGSQIYEDIYNPSIKEASCGSSSLKVGLYFRIK